MMYNFSNFIDSNDSVVIETVNYKLSTYDKKLYYTGLENQKNLYIISDELLESETMLDTEAVRIIITNDNNDLQI